MKKPIFLTILTAAVLFPVFSCKSISTEIYNLESPLIKENTSVRIVLVSDLHNTIYGKNQSILIGKITEQNPDLIVLAGDMFDSAGPMKRSTVFLSGISGIAPIFYVTGNHEYASRKMDFIRETLLSHGVIILSDSYERITINGNEIIIAGIEDPYVRIYESPGYNQGEIMEERFRELDNIEAFSILAAHRPERIEMYKRFSFDLVLSGHAHGGQVRIPGIMNGLVAPHQGFFPKYAGGLYQHENLTHIVSRGLAVNLIPRIFNPPELVVIIVESDSRQQP
ncbi:MAG: metallophosphoesterase [Treponema sp.]|nr:metallophosphoesterase [Treponema sp.]MCL2236814.1 metallophosphoesterase [Treponema sp.]